MTSSRVARALTLLSLAAPLLVCRPLIGATTAAALESPVVAVKGIGTTWEITLVHSRAMDRIPHTTWIRRWTDPACMQRRSQHHPRLDDPASCVRQYDAYRRMQPRIFVLTLRLVNTGARAAAPSDDLALTMAVMPPTKTRYPMGWVSGLKVEPYGRFTSAAAQQFGGALPWTTTAPGHATTYCYVIMAYRGEAHYGLYNAPYHQPRVFLFNTGL